MKTHSLSNNSINFKANFIKIPTEECKSFVKKYPNFFTQAKEMKLTNDEIITGIALHGDDGNISIDFRKNKQGNDIVEFMFEDPKQDYKKTLQEEMSGPGNFGTALYTFYYHMIERAQWINYNIKKDTVFQLLDLLKAKDDVNRSLL